MRMFFKSMLSSVGRNKAASYLVSGIGFAGLTAATAATAEDEADSKSREKFQEMQ